MCLTSIAMIYKGWIERIWICRISDFTYNAIIELLKCEAHLKFRTLPGCCLCRAGAGTQSIITGVPRGTGGAGSTFLVDLSSYHIAGCCIVADNNCEEHVTIRIFVLNQAAAQFLWVSPDHLSVVTHPFGEPDNIQWKLDHLLFYLSPVMVNIAGVKARVCHLIIPDLSGIGQIALHITFRQQFPLHARPSHILPDLENYNPNGNLFVANAPIVTLVPSNLILPLLSSWVMGAWGMLKHWSAHLWAMASSSLFHTFITGVRWQLLIFIWSPASSCWLPRAGRAPPPWPRASWAHCACPGLSSFPLQWDRGSWSGCCIVRMDPGWETLTKKVNNE